MILGIDDIRKLFSILHDGRIKSARINDSDLTMDVEIGYFASRIKPTFDSLQITLFDVTNLEFETWPNNASEQPIKLSSPAEIFLPKLEILSGEVAGDKVKVMCNQSETGFNYCGGVLSFSSVSATVIDQGGKSYLLRELLQISEDYWSDWKKRNAENNLSRP